MKHFSFALFSVHSFVCIKMVLFLIPSLALIVHEFLLLIFHHQNRISQDHAIDWLYALLTADTNKQKIGPKRSNFVNWRRRSSYVNKLFDQQMCNDKNEQKQNEKNKKKIRKKAKLRIHWTLRTQNEYTYCQSE